MKTLHTDQRFWLILGHLFFLWYSLWAVWTYEERLLAFDAAYYTFKLVYFADFNIEHLRHISYPTQVLPLLGMQAGASLSTVVLLYSLNLALFYHLIFIVLVQVLRQVWVGYWLIFSLILSTRYLYYHPITETQLTHGALALWAGWILYARTRPDLAPWKTYTGIGLGAFLVSTGHPLAILFGGVWLGFELSYENRWKDKQLWAAILALALGFLWRFWQAKANGYEDQKMNQLFAQLPMLWNGQLFKLFSLKHLLEYLFSVCWASTLAFVLSVGYVFYRRAWLAGLCLLLGAAGFGLIEVITYAQGESPIALENYYLFFGFFYGIPLALAVLPQWSGHRVMKALVLLLVLWNVWGIVRAGAFFEQRNNWLRSLAQVQDGQRKWLITNAQFPYDRAWMPWALPFETLLATAMRSGAEAAVTVAVSEPEAEVSQAALAQDTVFIGPFFAPYAYKQGQMPARYFALPRQGYRYR
jgi:hypothetical protein